MSILDELILVVEPPPAGVVPAPDWAATEARLGLTLPADYKLLVERYGPGAFDKFLHVLQPGCTSVYVQLEAQAERMEELFEAFQAGNEPLPYDAGRLLPVAVTDNGDTVYWIRDPEDRPDDWRIVANGARNTKWPEFDGGIVDFLVAVLSRATYIEVFPRAFPRPDPVFARYPAR
ncbi:SMI1/KNR4 family protein [Hamadaea tsunoensis]|uniref:SMI1/KNR4 family protein n=1 Tax=Hamadaea tsunoensis TaxID=53368 RepID=UPI0003F7B0AD|nr:SMI1/KNR4 family protein [Hamadaea tsunoensis]